MFYLFGKRVKISSSLCLFYMKHLFSINFAQGELEVFLKSHPNNLTYFVRFLYSNSTYSALKCQQTDLLNAEQCSLHDSSFLFYRPRFKAGFCKVRQTSQVIQKLGRSENKEEEKKMAEKEKEGKHLLKHTFCCCQ